MSCFFGVAVTDMVTYSSTISLPLPSSPPSLPPHEISHTTTRHYSVCSFILTSPITTPFSLFTVTGTANPRSGDLKVMDADVEASGGGDKGMQCASNCEDWMFHADEDAEVNIIGDGNEGVVAEGLSDGRCGGEKEERDDATESLSSFGDTEAENGNLLSDNEVESRDCGGNAPASLFDACNGSLPIRRKRLTDHWRRFMRPLMWRCKWLEMQITEFQSQAQKYDAELEEHEQRKQFDYGTFMVEGFHARSLPFSSCMQRKKTMKRKKRKRLEETTDLASYTLTHNLFSYCENKKSATYGASLGDDSNYLGGNVGKATNGDDDFGVLEGFLTVESRDIIHEGIFRKIESLQSQVHKLQARVEKVVNENPGKFASINRLSLGSPSSEQNPALLPQNGKRVPITSPNAKSQRMIENSIGDLVPESAVSSHGDVTPLPDPIESLGNPQVGVSVDNAEERILLPKNVSGEDLKSRENLGCQLIEMPVVAMENQMIQAPDPNLSAEMVVARVRFGGKSLPKSRSSVPINNKNNKRKRGTRMRSTIGWKKK